MKTETRNQLREICSQLRDLASSVRIESNEESKYYELHRLITEIYNLTIPNPEFYYEWGNEPAGYVSCGYYESGEVWRSLSPIPKNTALQLGLNYYCPYK